MKKILLIGFGALCVWQAFLFFQDDKKHLEKTLHKMVDLLNQPTLTDMSKLKRVEALGKHLHFNIKFHININQNTYSGRSLNQIKSLIFAYLRSRPLRDFSVSQLNTTQDKNKSTQNNLPQYTMLFDMQFLENNKHFTCKNTLKWIKEKKWYLKTIEVSSCSQNSP